MASKECQLVKSLMVKNLRETSSTAEAVYDTLLELIEGSSESQLEEFHAKVMEPFLQNITSNSCDICVTDHRQDMHFENNVLQFGVGSLDLNYGDRMFSDKYARDQSLYKKLRKWQKLYNPRGKNTISKIINFSTIYKVYSKF